jgi:hypothetical protein
MAVVFDEYGRGSLSGPGNTAGYLVNFIDE